MKTLIIIQARMTSVRLPGKVLKPVSGKTLLEYQLERLQRCKKVTQIVVATTTLASDDPIVALCTRLNVAYFRGPEDDVLSRFHGAVEKNPCGTIVRLTADCPLSDPKVVDEAIEFFEDGGYDYASNTLQRSYPRGLDVEVFSIRALKEAFAEAKQLAEREHVTPFFYTHPERFKLGSLVAQVNHSGHRWTVDTPEDFELIRRILEGLYPKMPCFTTQDVLRLLEQHPDWIQLNAHIEQKNHLSAEKSPKILIRADASARIGSGHIMRCLALAMELKQLGAHVKFICRELPGHLIDLIECSIPVLRLPFRPNRPIDGATRHAEWLEESWEVDAAETGKLLRDENADWLVVDHYALDAKWESRVRAATRKIFVIDDLADRAHECDVLLDHGYFEAPEKRYEALLPASSARLLGPRYALLRREFAQRRGEAQERDGNIRELLVFCGAADLERDTIKILEALTHLSPSLKDKKVRIVIGAMNSDRATIREMAKPLSFVVLHERIEDMAEAMSRADLFVGSGGTTNWERCCMGLPSIVIAGAENQVPASMALSRAGCIRYLGRSTELNSTIIAQAALELLSQPAKLRRLSNASRALVDGFGASRAAQAIIPPEIRLRPARPDDCRHVHEWRDFELNRNASFDSTRITYGDHEKWFNQVLNDSRRALLIGEFKGEAIGVLRYDLQKDEQAVVSIYLVPGWHGRGLGAPLLIAGTSWLRSAFPKVRSIVAEIKGDNTTSRHSFKKAGYVEQDHIFVRRLF